MGQHRPMILILQLFITILILCDAVSGFAAIQKLSAKNSKKNHYIEYGTISGGEAGFVYTLLNLRRIVSKKDKIERLLLDLGDDKGQPLKKKVSYFHVSLDKSQTSIHIDLSQMNASAIDQAQIEKIFKQSSLVKSSKINFDPVDNSITIQIQTKKKVMVEAFEIAGPSTPSRIALDLKEKL